MAKQITVRPTLEEYLRFNEWMQVKGFQSESKALCAILEQFFGKEQQQGALARLEYLETRIDNLIKSC